MKKIVLSFLVLYMFMISIPLLVSGFSDDSEKKYLKTEFSEISPEENITKENIIDNKNFKVLIKETEEVKEIPIYDYICGVVAAEMSATNNIEALKAQAVAAYTYSIYKMEKILENPAVIPEHKGAYVCTDYNHCKAFLSKENAKEKWGEKWFEKYYPNIENAVKSVKNKIITYNNEPINAVFHSMSSGKTEAAKDVWGSEIPYLKSVNSNFDKSAPLYESIILISFEEFRKKIYEKYDEITFPESETNYITHISRSDSGGVISLKICGKELKGTDFRKIFGLRSTNFNIEQNKDGFTVTVFGYGHGVGMSQYGANELAKKGKSYIEILKHYYSNVEIKEYSWN